MIIKNAEFLTSVADSGKLPDFGAPEIAFAGKSNVGKSSFINFLTGNGKLARTSGDPGRTRLLNFFGINGREVVFVDLPGYGFAKVAKTEKAKWGAMIEGYLTGSANLKNVFVLLDVRHEPTADDKMLLNFLYHYNIPFTVIATKCDKLSRAQLTKRRAEIASSVGVGTGNVYMISALKKTGKEEILARLDALLAPVSE
ncbi:MAG TPA: YihA family ribosome biogenesis GTP-binding protein [Candidatus Limadaptatus stercorigallinarum]|uniref:Probable GTP-binding protein EngB n=1 Tax=Candidatus Limadaptatus stercorigallinarum TaxID=2840845 RepID=A0A9D1L365_9FIRM|nr:ribosome biogenesis GTP-binding protein YihA/YsxC [Christensenellales bacterium]HIU21593.1 YihA family ribosome biogenesis GTP-binding protein [Candidatus Limadaptatus stercorigallinarum]